MNSLLATCLVLLLSLGVCKIICSLIIFFCIEGLGCSQDTDLQTFNYTDECIKIDIQFEINVTYPQVRRVSRCLAAILSVITSPAD